MYKYNIKLWEQNFENLLIILITANVIPKLFFSPKTSLKDEPVLRKLDIDFFSPKL